MHVVSTHVAGKKKNNNKLRDSSIFNHISLKLKYTTLNFNCGILTQKLVKAQSHLKMNSVSEETIYYYEFEIRNSLIINLLYVHLHNSKLR